jgi:hypothetical protein
MYLILFTLLAFLSLLVPSHKPGKTSLISIILLVSIFVGIRGGNVDNDYQTYLASIKTGEGIREFSFYWISNFLMETFHNTVSIFLFYSICSISLKFLAFAKLSNFFWPSLLIYFPTFFILQEMNAIRAGLAAGLLLISIPWWSKGKILPAFLLIIVAIFFHYSFIILVPVLLLVRNTKSNLWVYISLVPLAYILSPLCFKYLGSVIQHINLIYLSDKMVDYSRDANSQFGNTISLFYLVKILFLGYFYKYRDLIASENPYFYLLFKLYCIGIFLVVVLNASSPLAAMRIYEIFVIVELFLIPTIIFTFSPRIIPILVIIGYSSSYYYLHIVKSGFLNTYHTCL